MNLVERVVLIRELRSVADHLDAQEKLVAQIHKLRALLEEAVDIIEVAGDADDGSTAASFIHAARVAMGELAP